MQNPNLALKVFRMYHLWVLCFVILLVILLLLILGLKDSIIAATATISTLYLADLIFNLRLVLSSLHNPGSIKVTSDELKKEREWPTYTVFCPLYKESAILNQFVEAMTKIDYPIDKMTIMLLLEEDDEDTINAARNLTLPKNFITTVVPDSLPKTKPKACNYGLMLAQSEYAVIFDAEDIPDTDQLKKAVLAFENTPANIACLQAKLNFYNPSQNILTRLFTQEYSLWFNLILVGLQNFKGPVPLGGTSNHFRSAVLKSLGGWDPYNVTEDCDLGMRLFKQGFYTGMLDSYTLEEANSQLQNWMRQRSRWIKGYMQTLLVHTGKGRSVKRKKFDFHNLTFHLVVSGKIFTLFVNPLMILMTITYFIARGLVGSTIKSVYPAPVFYMALITLLAGNFLYVYYYILGCIDRRNWSLIKYAVFIPIYWLLMSLAGSIGLYQLLVKPHYWEKTIHGLHLTKETNV